MQIIIINFCRSISDCTSYAYENNIVLGTTQSRHIFSLKSIQAQIAPEADDLGGYYTFSAFP
jgi:hypothetical protein